ncbi:MAG: helix-turn-helix transcriptional regulator [Candidatus Bathyarchaeia archaeon]|jgi:DNA-binding PadR family transcriptional regulator|nr:helix-turn-helix transcriptional regulator [Candidatus Bathyarchaeota archaeon]
MFEDAPEWRFKHFMRHMAFVPKGFVRYYVLRLLSEKPMSGSEIIQHVEEKSEGRWRPSPGSVYPLLAWLQEEKYIKEVSAEEAGIKRYTLTNEGKKFLEAHENKRRRIEERFKCFGPPFHGFFEPPWLSAQPEHVKALIRVDFELQKVLWELKKTIPEKEAKENISKAIEILKEATSKIKELTKKD